jgi:hypothetical protein
MEGITRDYPGTWEAALAEVELLRNRESELYWQHFNAETGGAEPVNPKEARRLLKSLVAACQRALPEAARVDETQDGYRQIYRTYLIQFEVKSLSGFYMHVLADTKIALGDPAGARTVVQEILREYPPGTSAHMRARDRLKSMDDEHAPPDTFVFPEETPPRNALPDSVAPVSDEATPTGTILIAFLAVLIVLVSYGLARKSLRRREGRRGD